MIQGISIAFKIAQYMVVKTQVSIVIRTQDIVARKSALIAMQMAVKTARIAMTTYSTLTVTHVLRTAHHVTMKEISKAVSLVKKITFYMKIIAMLTALDLDVQPLRKPVILSMEFVVHNIVKRAISLDV